jgi:putative DNA primase/helicase
MVSTLPTPTNSREKYAYSAFKSEIAELAMTPHGSRNDQILKCARALASLVPHKLLSEAEIRSAITAIVSGWPDLQKSLATMENGIRYGLASPRELPDDRPLDSSQSPQVAQPTQRNWPEPKPLPDSLLAVDEFDVRMLPASIAPWVSDIADRMSCPLDYVAVPAIVALGSVIGCKIGIRPQQRTNWTEVANLWGCIIGPPGAMKSPAVAEALKPLHRLERNARLEYDLAIKEHAFELERFKLRWDAVKQKAKGTSGADLERLTPPEKPQSRRYVTNDTSYEALGEILAGNPNGILTFRDELVSLLKTLDREEFAAARGFYLQGWNGTTGYSFDRITRGSTHLEALCIAMMGATQPGPITRYLRRATSGDIGDDGLIQRFGLLVWPDALPDWKDVDEYADTNARQVAWATFERLEALTPADAGTQSDEFEAIPFLHFDEDAQGEFRSWRADLEGQLRRGDTEMHPALQSHLAKYRKLVPSLALIMHLADNGKGPVTLPPLLRALSMSDYLLKHAKRCYAAGSQVEVTAAKAILFRIRRGDLCDGFTSRDVHQRGWSGLAEIEHVKAGLDLLVDLGWLADSQVKGVAGGRPKVTYEINPRGMK